MPARFDWISGLSRQTQTALDASAKTRRFANRKLLCAKGDEVEGCYQILSGSIRQFALDAEGRETLIYLLGVGEVVGDSTVVAGTPYPLWLEAKGETFVRWWSASELNRLRYAYPEIQDALFKQTSRRLHTVLTFISELGTLSSADRIAARILYMLGDDDRGRTLACSQSDIAAMTHSTRQTVNETLGELKRLGILNHRYGKIEVCDVRALRSFHGRRAS